jgi:hypothetical protein
MIIWGGAGKLDDLDPIRFPGLRTIDPTAA